MRVAVILLTALAAATIAGCGSGSHPVAAPPASRAATTSATPSATSATPVATPPPITSRPTATGSARPPAGSAATVFRADLTVQRPGLALLALTNTGSTAHTVRGWPTVEFRDTAGRPVAVPVRDVAVPGAGPSITIGAGQTAFAGVAWTVADRTRPGTFVANSLRLTPPGGYGAVTVHVIGAEGGSGDTMEFDLTSAQVGTLQPSSEGVLAF